MWYKLICLVGEGQLADAYDELFDSKKRHGSFYYLINYQLHRKTLPHGVSLVVVKYMRILPDSHLNNKQYRLTGTQSWKLLFKWKFKTNLEALSAHVDLSLRFNHFDPVLYQANSSLYTEILIIVQCTSKLTTINRQSTDCLASHCVHMGSIRRPLCGMYQRNVALRQCLLQILVYFLIVTTSPMLRSPYHHPARYQTSLYTKFKNKNL